MCWACAVPVVDQIHGCSRTHPAADDGSSLGNGKVRTSPGPSTRPTRTFTRTPPRLNPTEHETEACIRTCAKSIIAKRFLVGGQTCHFALAAQPSRVPYGYGELIGKPFEYRSGRWVQVYLLAPALEFAKPTHGPQEQFSESQLRAYPLPVDPRHATSHTYIRQCPSPPAAPANATLYLPRIPGLPRQRWAPPRTHDDRRPRILHDQRTPNSCGNIAGSPISPPPAVR